MQGVDEGLGDGGFGRAARSRPKTDLAGRVQEPEAAAPRRHQEEDSDKNGGHNPTGEPGAGRLGLATDIDDGSSRSGSDRLDRRDRRGLSGGGGERLPGGRLGGSGSFVHLDASWPRIPYCVPTRVATPATAICNG